jgi:hypothetical protein
LRQTVKRRLKPWKKIYKKVGGRHGDEHPYSEETFQRKCQQKTFRTPY